MFELRSKALGEDISDPSGSACVLALVENGTKVCIGQNGVALEVRIVFLDIFPNSLFSLSLTCAIDIPSSVGLGVGWIGPSLVNGELVPRVLVDVELFVRHGIGGSSRGRGEDESPDRGFFVGSLKSVCDASNNTGNDIVGVFGEGDVGSDMNNSLAACRESVL